MGKHLLLLILLSGFFTAPSQAQRNLPPPAIFSSAVWYDGDPSAALPAGINKGSVKYYVSQTQGGESRDFAFDFEVALQLWLKRLSYHEVRVVKAKSESEADLLVHFGPKIPATMDFEPAAIHYRTRNKSGRMISVIHISSTLNPEMVTLREALKLHGNRMKWRDEAERTAVVPLADVYGDAKSPSAVAATLIRLRLEGQFGGWFAHDQGRAEIALWTFIHELGHAFGLGDQYARDGFKPENLGKTIMADGDFRPLYPTDLDIQRVSKHSCESGLLTDCRKP